MLMNQHTPKLQCIILDTGYCTAWEHHLIQGGRHRQLECHSLVALLQHPTYGWLLWDTGYAPRMLDATQHLPFALYRHATPLHLDQNLSVITQLQHLQIPKEDIRYVIISHFHADHIAGLRDFPQATFIASEAAYSAVRSRRGIQALRRAFIPALLPDDFEARAQLLSHFQGVELPALGPTHDVFDDGSLLLITLPGHAHGQLGLLASTERGQLLFSADGCWLRRSIYECRPPSRLTNLFVDDPRAVTTTIQHLHTFTQLYKDVVIIPSHCPEAYEQEVQKFHEDN